MLDTSVAIPDNISLIKLPNESQTMIKLTKPVVQQEVKVNFKGRKEIVNLNKNIDKIIETLKSIDVYKIFSVKVKDSDAPNYSKIITNPIDLGIMKLKAKRNEYSQYVDFMDDVGLMRQNSEIYNSKTHEVTFLACRLERKA